MQYSIIQKSQLEGALRLDAEYYQPEYLELVDKLNEFRKFKIGEISDIVYGTTPTGGIFEENGVPFVRSQNFSLLNIDENIVYCSESFHKQNKKSKVESGDILFAVVGATIGQLAIVQDKIKEANINQNIAGVKIKDKRFSPHFVGIFFASRFGQFQIERLVTGNAQFYLNTEQIKNFVIPLLKNELQDKTARIFKKSQKELENSKTLYHQAEELLLEELGLKDFEPKEDLAYVVNFSDAESADRIDAEYFQPRYEKLVEAIKKNRSKTIKELSEVVGHPSNPSYSTDADQKNKTYILTQKHLAEFSPKDNFWQDEDSLFTTEEFLEKNKEYMLKNEDLVLYSVGAYIGKTNIYNINVPAIIGSFLTLIRPRKDLINPYYFMVFMN